MGLCKSAGRERLTERFPKPCVAGSNPARTAFFFARTAFACLLPHEPASLALGFGSLARITEEGCDQSVTDGSTCRGPLRSIRVAATAAMTAAAVLMANTPRTPDPPSPTNAAIARLPTVLPR